MPRYTSGFVAAVYAHYGRKQRSFSKPHGAHATRTPRTGKNHNAAPIRAAHSLPTAHYSGPQTPRTALRNGAHIPQNRRPTREVRPAPDQSQPKTLSRRKTQPSEMSGENKYPCVAHSTKFRAAPARECKGR